MEKLKEGDLVLYKGYHVAEIYYMCTVYCAIKYGKNNYAGAIHVKDLKKLDEIEAYALEIKQGKYDEMDKDSK